MNYQKYTDTMSLPFRVSGLGSKTDQKNALVHMIFCVAFFLRLIEQSCLESSQGLIKSSKKCRFHCVF